MTGAARGVPDHVDYIDKVNVVSLQMQFGRAACVIGCGSLAFAASLLVFLVCSIHASSRPDEAEPQYS